jgi:hypothetical protein
MNGSAYPLCGARCARSSSSCGMGGGNSGCSRRRNCDAASGHAAAMLRWHGGSKSYRDSKQGKARMNPKLAHKHLPGIASGVSPKKDAPAEVLVSKVPKYWQCNVSMKIAKLGESADKGAAKNRENVRRVPASIQLAALLSGLLQCFALGRGCAITIGPWNVPGSKRPLRANRSATLLYLQKQHLLRTIRGPRKKIARRVSTALRWPQTLTTQRARAKTLRGIVRSARGGWNRSAAS